uniref:Uncharacterized protein n=1 Tax=viral metagenome TaxID=1070528 RepID=A0A6C0DPB2_9ZZZZ
MRKKSNQFFFTFALENWPKSRKTLNFTPFRL